MNLEEIEPIIEDIIKSSLDERVYLYGTKQKNLTNRVASGRLRNSIKANVGENKQSIQIIQITAFGQPLMNTYAYWLVYNRKPGWAPSGDIEQWIRNKSSFKIRDFKTGRYLPKNDKNIKQVAFLISRSMSKFGFQNKPKNFIEISIDKIFKDPRIVTLIGQATEEELLNLIEGI